MRRGALVRLPDRGRVHRFRLAASLKVKGPDWMTPAGSSPHQRPGFGLGLHGDWWFAHLAIQSSRKKPNT